MSSRAFECLTKPFKPSALRGVSIAVLWKLDPAAMTAAPLFLPLPSPRTVLCWLIGMNGCVIAPVLAGILHRSRGIGYTCGILGAVLLGVGLFSLMVYSTFG